MFFHLLLVAAFGGRLVGPQCVVMGWLWGVSWGCPRGQSFSGRANMWRSWGDFCFQLWIFIVVTHAERDTDPG